jgi:hypothetical protein
MRESKRLLPCPFCGADAILRKEIEQAETQQADEYEQQVMDVPYKVISYRVRCFHKQIGCDVKPSTPEFATEDEAIACWNRRR